MRPDKHKKRQHAAYAKKSERKNSQHNRAAADTDARRISNAKPANAVHSGREQLQKDQSNISTGRKLINHAGVTEGSGQRILSEKKLSSDHSLPSFSRRKIESNWEQYEEPKESEESVDRRGADFTLLLNQTVGSDFRFKDEDSFDDSAIQGDIAGILSFNCVELAQKLQSISLPERLEIPRSVFDEEALEILDQDAVTSATMEHGQDPHKPQNAAKPITSDENAKNNYLDQELDDILTLTEKSRTSEAPSEVESHSSQRELVEETSSGLTSVSDEGRIHSSKDCAPAKHLACSEEDELDFLLSLDAPVVDVKSREKDELPVKVKDRSQNPTAENHPKFEKPAPVDSAPSVPSSSKIATENLDDWLDSILED